jgi:hypothetical protein
MERAPEALLAMPCAVGMPQDRLARVAARQAFVDLKQDFTVAVAGIPGPRGEWLRQVIHRAEEPWALWRARAILFEEIRGNDPDACTVRDSLQTGLDSLFAETEAGTQLPR